MTTRRHTTLSDLAEKLGLSPSTVSRALRDHPDISDKTKEKVLDMAARTHYQPNLIAQSLQNRSSNNIGVIVPEIRNTFFSTVISGIEEVAYEAGYTIMVCQSGDTRERELINTRALAANRVAGMLVSISQETTDCEHFRMVMRQGIPLVLFDRVAADLEASRVIVNDREGAYGAVRHLIERGRTKIAHIAGTKLLYLSGEREKGYLAALKDAGIGFRPEYLIEGGYHEEDGRRGAARLMNLSEPPDAIFTVNDPVAIGAFMYLMEQGIAIPEQVALVGFSNNPNTAIVRPRLTTVNQPAFEMGRSAALLLLEKMAGKKGAEGSETIVLPTELLVRESS